MGANREGQGIEHQATWEDRYKFPKQEGRFRRGLRRMAEGMGISPELADDAWSVLRTGATKEEYDILREELTPEKLAKIKKRISERIDRSREVVRPGNAMQMRGLHVDRVPSEEQIGTQVEKMRTLVEHYDQRQAGQQSDAAEQRGLGPERLRPNALNEDFEQMRSRAILSRIRTIVGLEDTPE